MLLWTLSSMLLVAKESVSEAQCYQSFNAQHGSCGHLLGEAKVDDCCLNPHFGYKDTDGVCHSCRPASWTQWSPWGSCTRSCLEGVQQRRRFCYGHGDCKDPHKLGNLQTRSCEEKTCCPEQGEWAAWGPWQTCSVSCGTGQMLRKRTCTSPPPVCGGSCSGQGTEYTLCDTRKVCPVHGSWADWGSWSPCGASCTIEGSSPPQRHSIRSCTNPTPSNDPPGLPCPGTDRKSERCMDLPYCAVPGGWGPWSAYSECPVSCGLGQRVRTRLCNNPAPRHGGQPCPGDPSSFMICNTNIHCPVNGEWAEWGEWSQCKRQRMNIKCKPYVGRQSRQRACDHKDWNGDHCKPGTGYEGRLCYDIDKCPMNTSKSDWGTWSLCQPNCGSQAQKTRTRECVYDLPAYKKTHEEEVVHFTGKSRRCVEETMRAPCLNVPPCT